MGQSTGKGETGGTPHNPRFMLAARDRSVAAVLLDKPAELIEFVRFSSQRGKYAPEWRARRAQLGALLMLSESAVKVVIKKCKASGVLVVREVPEPMSPNGKALHFSVNAKALEAIKSKGREILQRRGWLDPLKAKATKGQKRPFVGKGTKGLQRPSEKVASGSRTTLSRGKLRVSDAPLTTYRTNTSYKKNTHTGTAPVAALPTPCEYEDKKRNNLKETDDKHLREAPGFRRPPRLQSPAMVPLRILLPTSPRASRRRTPSPPSMPSGG